MNEFYIVNGQLYEVSPGGKEAFLQKFPNAVLQEQQEQVKTAGVGMGAAAPTELAPNMVSNLDAGLSVYQEPELGVFESIKNSFSNFARDIVKIGEFYTGESAAMDLASAALFDEVFGEQAVLNLDEKYGKDSWLTQGIGLDEILDAIPRYREQEALRKPTIAITDAISEGDVGGVLAGVVNSVVNAAGSIAYGISTLGAGYAFDFMAENYINYNQARADRLGTSLEELIVEEKDATWAPALLGVSQALLERIGIGKMTGLLLKSTGKSVFRDRIMDVLNTGVTEAITEWGQYGIKEGNKVLGETEDGLEASKTAIYRMFTEQESLESVLQGFLGGGGIKGGRYALKSSNAVRTKEEANEIDRNISALVKNKKVLENTNDENTIAIAEQNIETAKQNIAGLVQRSNDRIKNLSEEEQKKVAEINDQAVKQVEKINELQDKFKAKKITKSAYEIGLDNAKSEFKNNLLKIRGVLLKNQTAKGKVSSSIRFGKSWAKALNIPTTTAKTNKEFAELLNLDEKQAANIGGVYRNGQAVFNPTSASNTFQINIGAHEILHPILNSQIGDAIEQSKFVKGFKKRLTTRQKAEMDRIMESRGYGIDSGKYDTEYLTVFSDAVANKQLPLDKTLTERIVDYIKKFFKMYDMEIGFDNADQVFNFINEFNKSSESGEVSANLLDAIDTYKLQKELNQDNLQLSKDDSSNVGDYETKISNLNKKVDNIIPRAKNNKSGKFEYIISQNDYNTEYVSDVYEALVNGNMIDALLTKGKFFKTKQERAQFLQEIKTEDRNNLTDIIFKFNPEKNNSLIGWINSQLRFTRLESYKDQTNKDMTTSLDIEAGEIGAVREISTTEDYDLFENELIYSAKTSEKTNKDIKIDLSQTFGIQDKITKNTKSFLESPESKNVKDLTFANTPIDIAVNEISEITGVPVKKIVDLGVNLSTSQYVSGRDFIYDFIEDIAQILPLRNYVSKFKDQPAPDDLLGSSILLPKKLINDEKFGLHLYSVKGPEVSMKGRDPNIITRFLPENHLTMVNGEIRLSPEFKKQFTRLIGLDENGNPLPRDAKGDNFSGRSPEAQRVKSLLNFLSRVISNTAIRQNILNSGIDPATAQSLATRIAAGKGPLQLSQAEDYGNIKLNELIKMYNEQQDFSRFAVVTFNKDELREFAKETLNIDIDKRDVYRTFVKGKTTIDDKVATGYFYNQLIETRKYQKDFLSFLPDIFKDNKNLALSIAGFNGINTLHNDTQQLYNSTDIVLLDGDLNVIRDKRIENLVEKDGTLKKGISIKKLKANNILKESDLEIIDDLNNYLKKQKNTKNIPLLIKLKTVLNDPTIKLDTKEQQIKLFKDQNINRVIMYNLLNQYKMAYIKAGNTEQERKNRFLFIAKTLKFDTTSIDGVGSLGSLDFTVIDPNDDVSLENYDTVGTISKNLLHNMFLGQMPIFEPGDLKAGFVPQSMLAVAPNISAQEKIDIVKRNTQDKNQYSQAEDSKNKKVEPINKFDLPALTRQMQDMLSRKDKRYRPGEDLDEATAKNLANDRKKSFSIIAPEADDFVGLLYRFLGKGKQGDKDLEFFQKHLLIPFERAMYKLNQARVGTSRKYTTLNKEYKDVRSRLNKPIGIKEFTVDQALRVHMYIKNSGGIQDFQKIVGDSISLPNIMALNSAVIKDARLKSYANNLGQLTKTQAFYLPPDGNTWLIDNIDSDVNRSIENLRRADFLQTFNKNKAEIFDKQNYNRIEATYGKKFVNSLRNILTRMETGSSFEQTTNYELKNILDWMRGSVAVTMFLNTRSAVLQTISMVNFINWGDNNVFKQRPFSPQWNKDFIYLLNSDFLTERREGLRADILEQDIAEIAADTRTGWRGKMKQLHFKLLQKGFIFTKYGDSLAIATGGASFYRNRINTYLKQGKSQNDAERQAFLDFQQIANESQQSARPDRLSAQQTNEVGRIFLAFANTPMQYSRLVVKAAKDLIAGRGDKKTNISKMIYYGAVQSIIFNSLQQALFKSFLEDEEDKEDEDMKERVALTAERTVTSFLIGLGLKGVLVAGLGKVIKGLIEDVKDGKDADQMTRATMLEIANIAPAFGIKMSQVNTAISQAYYNRNYIDKIGLSLSNPILDIVGSTASLANVPLNRLINKTRNIEAIFDSSNDNWQRIAVALGWNRWNVGIEDKELEQAKKEYIIERQLLKSGSLRRSMRRTTTRRLGTRRR